MAIAALLLAVIAVCVFHPGLAIDNFAPVTRAYAETKGAELAAYKICTDAGVPSLRDLFADLSSLDAGPEQDVLKRHTEFVYQVLQHGKRANLPLKPELRNRLNDSYFELRKDPWGHSYAFFIPVRDQLATSALQSKITETYRETDTFSPASKKNARPIIAISAGKDGLFEFDADIASRSSTTSGPPKDDVTNIREAGG